MNMWKLATLGLLLTGFTALSTGLTTAYVMRPTPPAAPAVQPPAVQQMMPAPAVAAPPRQIVVTQAEAPAPRVVARPAVVAQAAPRPAVVPVAADCSTGGQRAMKIAKPGLVGTLAGAGLGAVGGAIANGGGGAGKGALIGGIAGAALGTGYGAYKTKQECGTIFGSTSLGF